MLQCLISQLPSRLSKYRTDSPSRTLTSAKWSVLNWQPGILSPASSVLWLGLALRLGLAQIKPCLFNKLNQISPDAPTMPFLLSQQHTTEQVIYKEKILLRVLEAWKFKRMVPTIGEQHHRDPMAGVHETGAWGPKSSCCQDLVLQHF